MTKETEGAETGTEPVPGSDEYNAAMAARFRNEGADTDTAEVGSPDEVPAMPEGGAKKFYNAKTGEYDWASHGKEAAYRAAQATKGQTEDEPTAAPEMEAEEADKQPGDDNAEASDIIGRAGLDPQALEQELMQGGKISPESREALNKVGISDALIDGYADGYLARLESARAAGLEYVGGEETWKQVQTWARSNLSEAELGSFRDALRGDTWKLAVDGIKARMAQAQSNGEGNLTVGNQPGSAGAVGYTSKAQMQKDMSDARYASDPAFRRVVMSKMQNATWSDDGGAMF